MRYIPNGVAPMQDRPLRDLSRWGLERRGYFLYAGRLSPEKGLEVLIQAHRDVPGPSLVLAGGSSYSDGYVDRLRAASGSRTVFTGFVTGALLGEVYSNALAFVLPSRMEGLSVALLEAMAYGLPVIASDIPENRELVDACGGYLFRLDDVEDLRRVLRSVAESPESAHRVGQRARDCVQAQFDWERIAGETVAFYEDVMSGSHGAPAGNRGGRTPLDKDVPPSEGGANP
jgi:glycosyltransferase involved in cell wall biosynthesis